MRVLGRFMMVGIVVGGIGLAAYGVARERYPWLDDEVGEAAQAAEELAWTTVEGLWSLMQRSAQQTARTDDAPAAPEPTTAPPPAPPVGEPAATSAPAAIGATPLTPRPTNPYEAVRYDLELIRTALAAQQAEGHDVVPAAQMVLEAYLPRLMEAWVGTAYHYSGTTEVPGEGSVACGYYVSTVLEHAGFQIDRVELARQASEQIARSLVRDPEIQRFSNARRSAVVKAVKERGEGIFVVGLDTHAGFLFHRDGEVTFCHATRRGALGVVCEDAVSSPSMKSKYTVIGKVEDPYIVQSWLDGTTLPTARKGEPQAWPPPATEPATARADDDAAPVE